MNISSNGVNFIKVREGLQLKAYKLTNDVWTIGYGNTIYENGTKVKEGDTITQQRAESLLRNTLKTYENAVNNFVKVTLNQNQFDALVSYAFNRGVGSLKNSKLLSMVNQNPNDTNIKQQFVIEWGTNQTYKSALIKRRKLEGSLYFSENRNSIISSIIILTSIGLIISKIL